jgi:hypothetical protein
MQSLRLGRWASTRCVCVSACVYVLCLHAFSCMWPLHLRQTAWHAGTQRVVAAAQHGGVFQTKQSTAITACPQVPHLLRCQACCLSPLHSATLFLRSRSPHHPRTTLSQNLQQPTRPPGCLNQPPPSRHSLQVVIFPKTPEELKTPTAEEAFNPNGLAQRTISLLKDKFPDLEVSLWRWWACGLQQQ